MNITQNDARTCYLGRELTRIWHTAYERKCLVNTAIRKQNERTFIVLAQLKMLFDYSCLDSITGSIMNIIQNDALKNAL